MGAGAAAIRVTAADSGGLTATQSFVVAVGANLPPAAVATLPDVRLPELRATLDVDVSRAFDDPRRGRPDLRGVVFGAGGGHGQRGRFARDPRGLAHLLEPRQALAAAYAAAGRAAPTSSDVGPVAGTTPIRAAHLMELRAAVLALE